MYKTYITNFIIIIFQLLKKILIAKLMLVLHVQNVIQDMTYEIQIAIQIQKDVKNIMILAVLNVILIMIFKMISAIYISMVVIHIIHQEIV